MSICCIVNEKFRENVPAWEVKQKKRKSDLCLYKLLAISLKSSLHFFVCKVFKKEPDHFPFFFKCVMEAVLTGDAAGLSLKEETVVLVFLDHCFNSLVCTAITKYFRNKGTRDLSFLCLFLFKYPTLFN